MALGPASPLRALTQGAPAPLSPSQQQQQQQQQQRGSFSVQNPLASPQTPPLAQQRLQPGRAQRSSAAPLQLHLNPLLSASPPALAVQRSPRALPAAPSAASVAALAVSPLLLHSLAKALRAPAPPGQVPGEEEAEGGEGEEPEVPPLALPPPRQPWVKKWSRGKSAFYYVREGVSSWLPPPAAEVVVEYAPQE